MVQRHSCILEMMKRTAMRKGITLMITLMIFQGTAGLLSHKQIRRLIVTRTHGNSSTSMTGAIIAV